jgi:DHA1 family bicyclomycin/chloramphenicol resistance-like MFS transporter
MPGLNDQVFGSAALNAGRQSLGEWCALLLAVIPLSQIPLDADTPAMPDMLRDLVSSNALVQNTVTVYVLGMCLALIPLGMLADFWGRRRTLLAGLTLLVTTSVGCAAAPNIWSLLGLRFV